MTIRSVKDANVAGKTVFVRVDFNVPMRDGKISDDSRIRAALPTLNFLRENGAKLVVASHFGRPNGSVVEDMRLTPVRQRLSELMGVPVVDTAGPSGNVPNEVISGLDDSGVALLENLRFDPGEESNDPEFSRQLASLADLYVNDAFGAAHRAHASTAGIAEFLPSYSGLLMQKELKMLGDSLENSSGATVAVVGGAKVADKIQVLRHLTTRVDTILVGGGMVAAFLAAQGRSGGAADVSSEDSQAAMSLFESPGAQVILPADVVTAPEFDEYSEATTRDSESVPEDGLILDIGPLAAKEYARILGIADTIIWNGPMGVFEWESFANGSEAVAKAVAANKKATSVIGGGSTAEVVGSLGLVDQITHVSTGGGASLEFLEGKTLPGVDALDR